MWFNRFDPSVTCLLVAYTRQEGYTFESLFFHSGLWCACDFLNLIASLTASSSPGSIAGNTGVQPVRYSSRVHAASLSFSKKLFSLSQFSSRKRAKEKESQREKEKGYNSEASIIFSCKQWMKHSKDFFSISPARNVQLFERRRISRSEGGGCKISWESLDFFHVNMTILTAIGVVCITCFSILAAWFTFSPLVIRSDDG